MDISFLINRWIIPVILTGFYIWFLCYNKQISEYLKKRFENTKHKIFIILPDVIKLKIGNWRYTIALPIICSLSLVFFLAFILKQPLTGYGEPLWFGLITGGFLNPISEELLCRGIFLGFACYGLIYSFKWEDIKKYFTYIAGMIIISYFFTTGHINVTNNQFIIRFSSSMLYGVLYLINDRNLLPPIIGHSAINLFLVINDAL